jgi:hypothetical protein
MVKGRSMERQAHRVASVMSVRPGQAEGSAGEIVQAGHDPGPGSGSDLGLVFLVPGVADPVQGFDRPLFPDVAGQGGRACLTGGPGWPRRARRRPRSAGRAGQ